MIFNIMSSESDFYESKIREEDTLRVIRINQNVSNDNYSKKERQVLMEHMLSRLRGQLATIDEDKEFTDTSITPKKILSRKQTDLALAKRVLSILGFASVSLGVGYMLLSILSRKK
jgi:hypothetical protein